MNEKDRLKKTIENKKVDRPPCICPGGMMNMITTELMDSIGVTWPEAHLNAQMMASLSEANYKQGCFENVGIPFCMTIEAEAMGAEVTLGSKIYEPHITKYFLQSVADWRKISKIDFNQGRAKVVLDVIHILKARNLDVPIIGNVTGPISVASSLIEPVVFYKELRKKRSEAHEYLEVITKEILTFAKRMVAAGADMIALSDPSGTGEILGPKLFEEYTVTYINKILDGLNDENINTIVHICGQMKNVYSQVNLIHSDVLSFDSCVSMKDAKKNLRDRILMGNVSTYALEYGSPEKVKALAVKSWKDGASIISPACGLGTKSPLNNVRAMKEGIMEYKEGDKSNV